MMYGSSSNFLQGFDEEDKFVRRLIQEDEELGEEQDEESALIPERVALVDFLVPTRREQRETGGKSTSGSSEGRKKKKASSEKRKLEAESLRSTYGQLFSIASAASRSSSSSSSSSSPVPASGASRRSRSKSALSKRSAHVPSTSSGSTPPIVEEWTLRLLSSKEMLEVTFQLPQAYPAAPPEVIARLSNVDKAPPSNDKGKEVIRDDPDSPPAEARRPGEDDSDAHAFAEEEAEARHDLLADKAHGDAGIDRSLYNDSIASLLNEQAGKGVRVTGLAEMARQWLELYAERLAALERQRLAEARRKAEEEERARKQLLDLRQPVPEASNFQAWLLRLGLKKPEKPKYIETVDHEEIFERKLAERKRKLVRRNVEKLWTLCIQAMGDSLLRYESLAGFPLALRKDVLAYLVSDLRLLYAEHLEVLLDDEFDVLDFSGLARDGADNKVKDAHLKIVGARCPRLKEINLTGAVKLRRDGFVDGLARCHQLSRLVVDDCARVDDDVMAAVVEGCPLLTLFSARRCRGITHGTLYLLGRRCSDLSTVVVAGCENVALEGLINLTRMAKRLQILDAAETGNSAHATDNYYVQPNRLCNQWLHSVSLDRCKRVTNRFLKELLGPLPGQVCPNLVLLSLRECPVIVTGAIEEVILPLCPSLQALHYSVPKKASGVAHIDLNGLSFLDGCRYAFPLRSARLPPLLQMAHRDLSQNASADVGVAKTPITQGEVRKLVPNPTRFLSSVRRFERNVLARQAMRNIRSLTLGNVACSSEHNLLEFLISLPLLQYLDVSNSATQLRDLLLSCYYFLPRLETLICRSSQDDVVQSSFFPIPARGPAGGVQYKAADAVSAERFHTREKQVRAKLLLDIQKDALAVEQAGDKCDSAIKRKLWVVQHINSIDKRYSARLHTLNVSGHTFSSGEEFMDLIADRCPELRSLTLAGAKGIGERTLLHLLDKCVHLEYLDLYDLRPLADHTVASLRNKRPNLDINRLRSRDVL